MRRFRWVFPAALLALGLPLAGARAQEAPAPPPAAGGAEADAPSEGAGAASSKAYSPSPPGLLSPSRTGRRREARPRLYPPTWETSAGIQTTYDTFKSNRTVPCIDGQLNFRRCADIGQPEVSDPYRGEQVTHFLDANASYRTLRFGLETAYVKSQVKEEFGRSAFEGLADTGVSAAWVAYDTRNLGFILGASANLPTGRTRLNSKELTALPSDEVATSRIAGQGLNLGGSGQMLVRAGEWIVSLQADGTSLGKYDPTARIEDDTVRSGQAWSFTGLGRYQRGGNFVLDLSLANHLTRGIGVDSDTTQAGAEATWEPGKFLFSGSASFSRTSSRDGTLSTAFLAERRRDLSEGEGWSAEGSAGYQLTDHLTFLVLGGRKRSFFQSAGSSRVDEKTSYGAELSLKATDRIQLNAGVKRWRLDVRQPDLDPVIGNRVLRYEGWQVFLGFQLSL